MRRAGAVFVVLVLALVVLVALLFLGDRPRGASGKPIVLFCAAGIMQPMTTIAQQYEDEYGVTVQLQFAGSGTLLSNLRVAPGDLYLAADDSYMESAREMGLVEESIPVSFLTAGIGLAAGNPKNVKSIRDMQRDDVKIGFALPDLASVGKFARTVLQRHGVWGELQARAGLMSGTVNELANALKLGTIDAAIIWDAVANQYAEIDFVHVPEFDSERKQITIGVLRSSGQAQAALRFVRYVTARDRGLREFRKNGYEIIDGDVWSEWPETLLYSGAMLRPAIAGAIKAFEAREGVTIRPIYNGCGILVSQMKAGENPDAYFSCDATFMEMVQERFEEPVIVSANDMVILTVKGNPKKIGTLEDLTRPGVRLGLAHPEKSALGILAKALLEQRGVYARIVEAGNLAVDSATGDFLVNQIRVGSLDAVIVYRSNALAHPPTLQDCDLVEVDAPDSRAYQPYAVGKASDHKQLMTRFLQWIVSEEGKREFLAHGFHWELEE